jgi:hypothetical protein
MASNGNLPQSDLAPIAGGQLAKAAAAGFNAMNVESRAKYGVELRPTGSMSSYRSFSQQQYLYNLYLSGNGNLAAIPGTSNHGLGIAVDFATPQMRSIVDSIGAKYGWSKSWSDAPSEWWHIRYEGGHYNGPDPGPDGKALKPSWWDKVKRKLKDARKKFSHKSKRRKDSDNPKVRARLHAQLTRLRNWIKWAADRLKKHD